MDTWRMNSVFGAQVQRCCCNRRVCVCTIRGTWGVWLTLTSVFHDLCKRFAVLQGAHSTYTASKVVGRVLGVFFGTRWNKIKRWLSPAEERRRHTLLLSLHSCFYLDGEVCAKNSSTRSSQISAKLLGYITEQSIDTSGWTGPLLITSTHNFKYREVLVIVEHLYSPRLWRSLCYFQSFEGAICKKCVSVIMKRPWCVTRHQGLHWCCY